jgi:hypothetical protein
MGGDLGGVGIQIVITIASGLCLHGVVCLETFRANLKLKGEFEFFLIDQVTKGFCLISLPSI